MENLTQSQIDERVAILKRFRSLLEQQREKFREYLSSLEAQEKFIESNNTNAIVAHAELEQQVVANISSLQKVIVPMGELYNSTNASNVSAEAKKSIEEVQKELAVLQEKVLQQNEKNRKLLRMSINLVKEQIAQIKNPYKNIQSVYAMSEPVAQYIHTEA